MTVYRFGKVCIERLTAFRLLVSWLAPFSVCRRREGLLPSVFYFFYFSPSSNKLLPWRSFIGGSLRLSLLLRFALLQVRVLFLPFFAFFFAFQESPSLYIMPLGMQKSKWKRHINMKAKQESAIFSERVGDSLFRLILNVTFLSPKAVL